MIQKILERIRQEDAFELFISKHGPAGLLNNAAERIGNKNDINEIEQCIMNFFSSSISKYEPNTFYHMEAVRLAKVAEQVLLDTKTKVSMASLKPPRDLSDEIIDLYMESLRHFSAGLNEPVLEEHIKYLDR
jgi:hypothetical protein